MKRILFLILLAVLFSCNEKEDTVRNYMFLFYPRMVKYIWIDYSALVPVAEIDGVMGYTIGDFTGESLISDLLLLGVYTSNLNLDTVKRESIIGDNCANIMSDWPMYLTHYHPISFLQEGCVKSGFVDKSETLMEERIKTDYTRYMNSLPSSGSQWMAPPIAQDYRLTEIKNLTIMCNATLFGIAAGSSLNNYFHIYNIDPGCVFYGNKQMAMDHAQAAEEIKSGFSIEKWLSFRPISATWFHLKLTAAPPELPVSDAVFTITMETADGDILECKSKPVTLTR